MSIIMASPPQLKLVPREHFWVSGIKRGFELTALLPLYVYVRENLEALREEKDLELAIGTSTIVYEVKNEEIHLITGWNGSRK